VVIHGKRQPERAGSVLAARRAVGMKARWREVNVMGRLRTNSGRDRRGLGAAEFMNISGSYLNEDAAF
jgi:hypothetical protein